MGFDSQIFNLQIESLAVSQARTIPYNLNLSIYEVYECKVVLIITNPQNSKSHHLDIGD